MENLFFWNKWLKKNIPEDPPNIIDLSGSLDVSVPSAVPSSVPSSAVPPSSSVPCPAVYSQIANIPKLKIKHLVISGGGVMGACAYGAIRECHNQGILDICNIESIHGTSIGAWFAVFIALKYECQVLDDYIVKRPWMQVFQHNMCPILSLQST